MKHIRFLLYVDFLMLLFDIFTVYNICDITLLTKADFILFQRVSSKSTSNACMLQVELNMVSLDANYPLQDKVWAGNSLKNAPLLLPKLLPYIKTRMYELK